MKLRASIHIEFVKRFNKAKSPLLATDSQLNNIENELKTKLPQAYRDFMLSHGSVYTPSILDEIVENELEFPDIQNIKNPQEVIESTKSYWSAGMPEDLIGVASDCMGNIFCFHRQIISLDDAPIFFFDHDFVEVNETADSFDKLLNWYLDNLKTNGS